MTIYELIDFKKMVRVWKPKSPLFCLRYDPLIVFRRQNHVTFIFIKTMSHDLLVQMACYGITTGSELYCMKLIVWNMNYDRNTYSASCRYFQVIFLGLPLENRVFLFTWIKAEEWSHHRMALTASRLRRCWEEKTTRSNWMKFRLK